MDMSADLDAYNLFRRIMTEVGETLHMSRDPSIIAAVREAKEDIKRGEIIWDRES